MGSGNGRAGVSWTRVSVAQLRPADITRRRLALRLAGSACGPVAPGRQTEWRARGRGVRRVSDVSACGGATGRKWFADPASPAVRCAAACAPLSACHPPGAVEAAGVRAGLFTTSPRRTHRLVGSRRYSRSACIHTAPLNGDRPPACGVDAGIPRHMWARRTHVFGSKPVPCVQNRPVLAGSLSAGELVRSA